MSIFKPSDTSENESLTDSLIKISNWYSSQLQETQRKTAGMYDEFDDATKSYSNEEINFHQKRAKDYYNANSGNMDSQTIDRFQLLDERYEYQKKKNSDYLVQKERAYEFSENILGLADEYGGIDDASSFEWETSSFDAQGNRTSTKHSVIVPEFGTEEYKKWFEEIGGTEGYLNKKEEYKIYLKNEIEKNIGEYSDYQDEMMQKHGDRLTNKAFYGDLLEMQDLDNAYSFVIDSLTDDGRFDEEERNAYQSAIVQKKYDPISQFKQKDKEVKTSIRGQLIQDMEFLKGQGDAMQSHHETYFETQLLIQGDAEALMKKESELAFTDTLGFLGGTKNEPVPITYGEIKEAIQSQGKSNPELYQYLTNIENNMSSIKSELKGKNEAFMKNDGGSFVEGMDDSPWAADIYGPEKRGFTPPPPPDDTDPGLKIDISENVKEELVSSDINTLNVSSEISEIDPKYQKGGKYSTGGKKLENEINKLNESVDSLANKPIKGNKTNVGSTIFTPGNTVENFFNWPKGSGGLGGGVGFGKALQRKFGSYSAELIPGLSDITGKDHKDGNFTSEDLLKIEQQYKRDVETKTKLVNQYRSLRNSGVDKNSPQLLELQKQINDIYQKWYAREEADIATFATAEFTPFKRIKRDWNLALEDSGDYNQGATALYKFMGFLRLRLDEER